MKSHILNKKKFQCEDRFLLHLLCSSSANMIMVQTYIAFPASMGHRKRFTGIGIIGQRIQMLDDHLATKSAINRHILGFWVTKRFLWNFLENFS